MSLLHKELEDIESIENEYKNNINEFENHIKSTKNELIQKFNHIKALLNEKQNQMLDKINEIEKEELETFNAKLSQISKFKNNLQKVKQDSKSIENENSTEKMKKQLENESAEIKELFKLHRKREVKLSENDHNELEDYIQNEFSGQLFDTGKPLPPKLQKETNVEIGSVKLRWEIVKDERDIIPNKFLISYKLEDQFEEKNEWIDTKLIENKSSLVLYGLKPGKYYIFKIKGCHNKSWSDYSSELRIAIQACKLVMVGLDNSGKTTILYKLKLNAIVTTIPTIGFNVETVYVNNLGINIYDIGGQAKIQPLWYHYYQTAIALIFVIDSSDRDKLTQNEYNVKSILKQVLSHSQVKHFPLLIYSNKQDITNCLSVEEITQILELNNIKDRKWYNQGCSAHSGDGLFEGLKWLHAQIPNNYFISFSRLDAIINYYLKKDKIIMSYQWNKYLTNIVRKYYCKF